MIYIRWSKSDPQMKIINSNGGTWYADVSCDVRNELNGRRPNPNKKPSLEVVHAITKSNEETNLAVMPRQFPNGIWKITKIEPRTDGYRAPFIIFTDAWQVLNLWRTGPDGGYLEKTNTLVNDYIYGLHFSMSNTTQGCIKIHDIMALRQLVKELNIELEQNEYPTIEVLC